MVLMLPIVAAVLTIVVRNPIHAILWLIATFLISCGVLLHTFSLGFTCSLIIIVYIGAIAIRFLFIVMMIPIQARPSQNSGLLIYSIQAFSLMSAYVGGCFLLTKHLVSDLTSQLGELWLSVGNQLDFQQLSHQLPFSERNGVTMNDLKVGDIALYGARLYQEAAFPILLTGLVLFFVLLAAIVLCQDD